MDLHWQPPTPGDPAEAGGEGMHGGADGALRARLFERLYRELRVQAAELLGRERTGHTLQPTALVHEAWFRLLRGGEVELSGRAHFLALAARAMRQVLVDHARARLAAKRQGPRETGPAGPLWDQGEVDLTDRAEDLLSLEAALEELRAHSPRRAQVVELRFHGGLGVDEAALALGVSRNTVDREWRAARAFLARRMSRDGAR